MEPNCISDTATSTLRQKELKTIKTPLPSSKKQIPPPNKTSPQSKKIITPPSLCFTPFFYPPRPNPIKLEHNSQKKPAPDSSTDNNNELTTTNKDYSRPP
ncbi:hypothetical protein EMIT051CA3_10819 [Pseudomonas chlororaphis]